MEQTLKTYLKNHDETFSFFIIYLCLGIVLSLLFNIGVFILLVLAHYLMDLSKHRILGKNWSKTFAHSTKDITIDISFVMVGLVLSIYLHHGLILGLSKGAFKTMYLLEIMAKSAIAERSVNAFVHYYMFVKSHKIKKNDGELTRFERFSWSMIGASVALILISPIVLNFTFTEFLSHVVSQELVPRFEVVL